jgi:hypothetical protein
MTDATPAPAPDATPSTLPSDAAALAARDAELTESYYYSNDGALAREHLQVRQAQKAAEATAKAPPQPAEQAADGEIPDSDVDAIDLDGEEPAEAEEAEQAWQPRLKPWEPPDGQEIAEAARPHLEALDGIASDEGQRDKIIDVYQRMVEAQTTRLAELNKSARTEMVASLKAELGDGYADFKRNVDESFSSLPKELQSALRTARLPDGRLLITMPEMVRTISGLNGRQSSQHVPQPPQGSQASMQQELRDIDALMTRDIDEYRRPNWRGLGVSASERHLQIMRQLDNPDPNPAATAAALESEKAALLKLRRDDPTMFSLGSWRGGRSAAERLAAIQAGRG